jgi:NAD(P)H-flavin reductase
MRPHLYRVRRVRRETHDTVSMVLAPEADPLPTAAPGQFNMLYAFGVGEVPISLSATAANDGAVMHTLRAVGAVTAALCASKRGDAIGVRGPFGTAWPVDEAAGKDVLIVAGGIGLAPLRAAVEAIVAQRRRYGRVVVLYGSRTPDDLIFVRDLDRWQARGVEVAATVDSARAEWGGRVGIVTGLIPRARLDPARTIALICGPELMMRYTVAALRDLGVAEERIYVSLERNMKCAVGFCGHCQLGPAFICKDGPVFRHDRIAPFLGIREV